ncbi:MAG TPA: bifunctional (p)ppGpp synthetase/guanosine-3',5'-bis(diphosphate) 3'-pyrophosphohydrolase [Gammaproteobacteria bacterium]|nr:bifunctional (p)ppGpp synthetase/guanosine-3',5'-bis(diphosphate) 3'-pyrophosphohydrolase [Gammaproteobacteria bacterium]
MESIDALSEKLSDYLEPKQIEQVNKAFEFANEAHSGQFRTSGDPYVSHPIAVANILSSFHMDEDSLSAAMLHDVIEDCGVPKKVIEEQFNKNVANLVDGVSKLDQLNITSRTEAYAENFQKMILAMAKDIRVIVVKLADRLHNMRTIEYLDLEKQKRKAKETLEIYAPIAHRIGMNNVYRELEDRSFKVLYPTRYRQLRTALKKNRGSQKRLLEKIKGTLEKKLVDQGIPSSVEGREKHTYSVYRKMKESGRSFEEIMDVCAFKLIVDSADNCYKALGLVHSIFKPIEGRFKDYISIPKSNGYQSIHTVVVGFDGQPIEIQIKTEGMNEMAENGIASHWVYKMGEGTETNPQQKARRWVAGLLEMRDNFESSAEFVESVKTDIFPDEIYVFTPQGEIIQLGEGSTAIDFAYAVHTDIGHHCRACRINRKLAPLSVPLESGQTIEILRDKIPQTSPAWLNFVATSRARNSIRHYLSNLKISEARKLGKKLLDQSLGYQNVKLRHLKKDELREALDALGVRSLNKLLEEIGLGKRVGNVVSRQMISVLNKESNEGDSSILALEITGTEGLVVNYATCCKPIPGDSVIGHFTSSGLVVHQERCKNILSVREDPTQCFPVNWHEKLDREFSTDIKILASDETGLLATMASAITSSAINIESINTQELDLGHIEFTLTLQVKGRDQLATLIRKLKTLKNILSIHRIHDQEMRQAKTLH